METLHNSSNRSKNGIWLAGTALAASASTVSADTVQITLNQQLSSDGTGELTADLTGDGNPDLEHLTTTFNPASVVPDGTGYSRFINRVSANSDGTSILFARFSSRYSTTGFAIVSTNYSVLAWPNTTGSAGPVSVSGLLPVAFSDSRINNGAETTGFLELSASSSGPVSNTIRFVRLVFDDSSTDLPDGVVAGETDNEFVLESPTDVAGDAAERSRLKRKIKALKRKIRSARRSGNSSKARKLRAKLKKLKKRLRAL